MKETLHTIQTALGESEVPVPKGDQTHLGWLSGLEAVENTHCSDVG